MKLYLAGPMTGLPDCNYPMFEEVAQTLREDGFEVVSPHELFDEKPEERGSKPRTHYMKAGLAAMLTCDTIVLLPDWQTSIGAREELMTALSAGLVVTRWDWLSMTAKVV